MIKTTKKIDLNCLQVGDKCLTREDGVLTVRNIRHDIKTGLTSVYWMVKRGGKDLPIFWIYRDDGTVSELSPHKHDIIKIL